MKLFANIVTWILHPIVLSFPAVFLIAYEAHGNLSEAFIWTCVSVLFSLLIIGFVLIGIKRGIFTNIDVSNRKQRVFLYPFAIIVVLLFGVIVYLFNGPYTLTAASICFVLGLIILDLINRKIKASIHVASVAAGVTGVVMAFGGFTYLLFLLIPLTAWARVVEKKHTPMETIVGACAGVSLTFVFITIARFLL